MQILFVGRQCHLRSGIGREGHALGVKGRRIPQGDPRETEDQPVWEAQGGGNVFLCLVLLLRQGLR